MTHDVGDAFAGTCLLCNVRATCVPLAMCVPLVGGGLQISGAELQEPSSPNPKPQTPNPKP